MTNEVDKEISRKLLAYQLWMIGKRETVRKYAPDLIDDMEELNPYRKKTRREYWVSVLKWLALMALASTLICIALHFITPFQNTNALFIYVFISVVTPAFLAPFMAHGVTEKEK